MNNPEAQQLQNENNVIRPANNGNNKISILRILVFVILLLNWMEYLIFEIPKKEKELKSLNYKEERISKILFFLATFELIKSFLEVYVIYFLVADILIILLKNQEFIDALQNFLEKLKRK